MEHKFTCEKCQKIYSSSQSLCNHRRLKHPEAVLSKMDNMDDPMLSKMDNIVHNITGDKNKCDFCKKIYANRHSKSKHMKICKFKLALDINDKNTALIKSDDNKLTGGNTTTIDTLNSNAINNGTINGTLNNGTINNNITINNFNTDNKEYFSDKFKNKILNYFKNNNKFHLPVPNVVQNLKFNPNHKENNNMKITNMKNKVGQKYENNKWIYCKKNDIFNDVHKMAVKMIEEWINEKPEDSQIDILEGFNDYMKVNQSYLKKVIYEEINQLGYVYYKNYMDNQLDD